MDLLECIDDMTNDSVTKVIEKKQTHPLTIVIRKQLQRAVAYVNQTKHMSLLFLSALSGRFAMSWLSGSVFAASSSSWGFSCKRNRFDAKFSLDSIPQDKKIGIVLAPAHLERTKKHRKPIRTGLLEVEHKHSHVSSIRRKTSNTVNMVQYQNLKKTARKYAKGCPKFPAWRVSWKSRYSTPPGPSVWFRLPSNSRFADPAGCHIRPWTSRCHRHPASRTARFPRLFWSNHRPFSASSPWRRCSRWRVAGANTGCSPWHLRSPRMPRMRSTPRRRSWRNWRPTNSARDPRGSEPAASGRSDSPFLPRASDPPAAAAHRALPSAFPFSHTPSQSRELDSVYTDPHGEAMLSHVKQQIILNHIRPASTNSTILFANAEELWCSIPKSWKNLPWEQVHHCDPLLQMSIIFLRIQHIWMHLNAFDVFCQLVLFTELLIHLPLSRVCGRVLLRCVNAKCQGPDDDAQVCSHCIKSRNDVNMKPGFSGLCGTLWPCSWIWIVHSKKVQFDSATCSFSKPYYLRIISLHPVFTTTMVLFWCTSSADDVGNRGNRGNGSKSPSAPVLQLLFTQATRDVDDFAVHLQDFLRGVLCGLCEAGDVSTETIETTWTIAWEERSVFTGTVKSKSSRKCLQCLCHLHFRQKISQWRDMVCMNLSPEVSEGSYGRQPRHGVSETDKSFHPWHKINACRDRKIWGKYILHPFTEIWSFRNRFLESTNFFWRDNSWDTYPWKKSNECMGILGDPASRWCWCGRPQLSLGSRGIWSSTTAVAEFTQIQTNWNRTNFVWKPNLQRFPCWGYGMVDDLTMA